MIPKIAWPVKETTRISQTHKQHLARGGSSGGIDFACPVRSLVYAVADGTVQHVSEHIEYGLYVILDHGEFLSLYGHLSMVILYEGAPIQKGDIIGFSGGAPGTHGAGASTGPHLHFEIRPEGSNSSIDPGPLLGISKSVGNNDKTRNRKDRR